MLQRLAWDKIVLPRRNEAQYRKKLETLFKAADVTNDGFLELAPWLRQQGERVMESAAFRFSYNGQNYQERMIYLIYLIGYMGVTTSVGRCNHNYCRQV